MAVCGKDGCPYSELAVLGSCQEGCPLAGGEDQRWPVRVLAVSNGHMVSNESDSPFEPLKLLARHWARERSTFSFVTPRSSHFALAI
jgi:hypothetical protein